jgi:hypothetical protein
MNLSEKADLIVSIKSRHSLGTVEAQQAMINNRSV